MPKILLVEPNADLADLEVAILGRGGHSCRLTARYDDAFSAWQAEDFDVCICDVDAPDGDGLRFVEAVAGAQVAPTIVLTGVDEPAIGQRLWELGADLVLVKPFAATSLLFAVRSVVARPRAEGPDALERGDLEDLFQRRTAGLLETIDRLRDSRSRIRLANEELIHAFSTAAEFGRHSRSAHTYRVGRHAALIALGAGASRERADRIRLAAALHDVGNLGVARDVLDHPDALSEPELAVMRRHTRVGYSLLAGYETPLLETASRIALSHHERWDGSGYPEGLVGERIPFEGRVVAIADVFDSMISERPHRPAHPLEDAFRFVSNKAGVLFDPDLVEVFVGRRAEVERLAAKYADRPEAPALLDDSRVPADEPAGD